MTTNIRDPRSIVTPDAFEVSDEMLGLPLATPGRRLAGILIDLVVIGFLTVSVAGWGFFVWGLIGLVMLQLAFKGPSGSWTQGQLGRATAWAFRGSAGCLGLLIIFLVGVIWLGSRTDLDEQVVEGMQRGITDARPTIEGIVQDLGEQEGLTAEELEPVSELLDAIGGGAPAAPAEDDGAELEGAVDGLALDELVDALLAARAEDAPDSVLVGDAMVPAGVWSDALTSRAIEVFAGDTVGALNRRAARQSAELGELSDRLEVAEEEADSGFFALARDILGQLGSAFGVWTLYFTVATVVTRGRTVGKLMTGTRVVRLDGEQLTWLLSLERAGGYAAGLATGLMGFMRVFWDRNRQCVHDRIAGTVVVMAGVAAEPGSWKEVWTPSEEGEQ